MGMQALSYLAMELGSYHITQKMTEHGMNKIVTWEHSKASSVLMLI